MNSIRTLIISIIFTSIGFSAGIYYGFKKGFENFSMLEQVVQGALSRHQLAAMEKNKIESVQHLFELNIDSGIHSYARYKQNGNKFLSSHFFPEHTSELERYVDLMAEYRKEHPIVYGPEWAKPVEGDDQGTKIWREQAYKESEKMLSEIENVLRDRGVPESALTRRSTWTQ